MISPFFFVSCSLSSSVFKRSHHEGRIYLHPSLPPPVASDTLCPQRRGRAKIDNDIICNVDHVCVKPDDGTRQIHIKIFYKYTRPEYQQPLRVSQRPPAWLSWIQSVGTSQARVPSPHPASARIREENIRDLNQATFRPQAYSTFSLFWDQVYCTTGLVVPTQQDEDRVLKSKDDLLRIYCPRNW